jgi:hypothetical protein
MDATILARITNRASFHHWKTNLSPIRRCTSQVKIITCNIKPSMAENAIPLTPKDWIRIKLKMIRIVVWIPFTTETFHTLRQA